MSKLNDLTGKVFGRLTVSKRGKNYISPGGQSTVVWNCTCSCGKIIEVQTSSLTSRNTQSCGCFKEEKNSLVHINDLTGKTFGRLTVIKRVNNHITNKGISLVFWRCRCTCGKFTETTGTRLSIGGVQSCGCIAREKAAELCCTRKGSSHPCWNPNLTEEDRQDRRNIYGYIKFIKDTIKRDNYTCRACCQKKSGKLNVHHKYSYAEYKDKRIDINNGVTLCKNCHSEFHGLFGRKDFTKFEFDIWLATKIINEAA